MLQVFTVYCSSLEQSVSKVWDGPRDVWRQRVFELDRVLHRRTLDEGALMCLGTAIVAPNHLSAEFELVLWTHAASIFDCGNQALVVLHER